MLGLIIEVIPEKLCTYLGVDCCSDLPLPTDDFLGFQLREMKSIGVTDFVFCGKQKEKYINEMCFEQDLNVLKKLLKNPDFNHVIVTTSNMFFQFSDNINATIINDLSSASFIDENGEISAVLIDKKILEACIEKSVSNKKLWEVILSEQYVKLKNTQVAFQIENVKDYKHLLALFLDSKLNVILPTVAEGIYSFGNIPKGDFIIIPPVFFGENVQIEGDCVIGPHTMIFDNCLVSEKTYVKKSVLFKDTFISRCCFIDDSVCGEGVCVRRDSALFGGCVLGKGVTVAESTFVENNSNIRPFTNVSEYKNKVINYKINDSCAGFYGYSPEKAALLGGAIGSVFKGAKIGVLCNKEYNSDVLKYAVVSGLMSTGAQCFDFGYGFLSPIIFYLNYCDIDYGVFIKGEEDGTKIVVTNKRGLCLSKDDFYSVKDKMLSGNITRSSKRNIHPVHQIKGLKKIYIRSIVQKFNTFLSVYPVFRSSNIIIEDTCKQCVSKLKFGEIKNEIIFRINDCGSVCECEMNNKVYSHARLCDFVSFFSNKVYENDEMIWRNDAVYLCFKILEILSENTLDFVNEMENIPSFYVAEKVIETSNRLPYITSRLADDLSINFKDEELLLGDDLRVKVIENGKHNKIKILAKSHKAEFANELTEGLEKLIRSIDLR